MWIARLLLVAATGIEINSSENHDAEKHLLPLIGDSHEDRTVADSCRTGMAPRRSQRRRLYHHEGGTAKNGSCDSVHFVGLTNVGLAGSQA